MAEKIKSKKDFEKMAQQSNFLKKLKDKIGVKDTSSKPEEFVYEKKNFVPIMKPMFTRPRDLWDLMKMAFAENTKVTLKEGEYGVDVKSGNCRLPLNTYNDNEKKIATLHAVSHVSITPAKDDLKEDERKLLEENKQFAEILEDVRINRYICYKYPGMLRYMPEIKQETLVDLCVGDLAKKEIDEEKYNQNILTKLLFKHKDDIRKNETYKDVLLTAKKLNTELKELMGDFEMPPMGGGCGGEGEGKESKKEKKPLTDEDLERLAEQIMDSLDKPSEGGSGGCGAGGCGGEPLDLSPEEEEKLREKLEEKGIRDKLGDKAKEAMDKALEKMKEEVEKAMKGDGSCKCDEESLKKSISEAMGEILRKIGETRAKEAYGEGATEEQIESLIPDINDIDDPEVKDYVMETMKEMVAKKALRELLEESMDDKEKGKKLRKVIFAEGEVGEFDEDSSINCNDNVKTVKQPSSFFRGSYEIGAKANPLNKSLLRFLQKKKDIHRRTRDGRLGKIDPVRKMTEGRIFHRKITKNQNPHFYFVLDCSGSMGSTSLKWQSTIAMTMLKLLKQAGIKHTILAHSGSGNEFWYAEMDEKDLNYMKSRHYNLDGTMLNTIFEEYIDLDEKSVIFYISDGGLPAEYSSIEAPLILRNMQRARKLDVPIIGIGLYTSDVKIFDEWFQITDNEELEEGIKKMGKIIMRTVG